MIDRLDAQILHALQLAPRVSFRRIAAVVGATEQTVAWRYQRFSPAISRTAAIMGRSGVNTASMSRVAVRSGL